MKNVKSSCGILEGPPVANSIPLQSAQSIRYSPVILIRTLDMAHDVRLWEVLVLQVRSGRLYTYHPSENCTQIIAEVFARELIWWSRGWRAQD